jgi:hypothetical protein
MSRHLFGWDLPPGVSLRQIEEAMGQDYPCDVCGNDAAVCICPECRVCGAAGDVHCYIPNKQRDGTDHGMVRTLEQQASYRAYLERSRSPAVEPPPHGYVDQDDPGKENL